MPLAADLACARPTVPDTAPAAVEKSELFPDPSADYSLKLDVALGGKDSAKSFLGVDDEQLAALQKIISDPNFPFTASIQEGGPKITLGPESTEDFLDEFDDAKFIPGSEDVEGSPTNEVATKEGRPGLAVSLVPNTVPLKDKPLFDTAYTNLFDENGLPSGGFFAKDPAGEVASSSPNYEVNLPTDLVNEITNAPDAEVASDPKLDYSIFGPETDNA